VTRLALPGAGLVRPAPRRSAHRKKRPRRPMVGMMLYQSLPSRKPGIVRAVVRIHEYPDGRLAVFHGPHRLAEYEPRDDPMTTPSWLPDPLRQPPCGFMDNSGIR
jgi:hypothetical protein